MEPIKLAEAALMYELGKTIPGDQKKVSSEIIQELLKFEIIKKNSIKIPCKYCGNICNINRHGDKIIAFHQGEESHKFYVLNEETYCYEIDYNTLLKWFVSSFFDPKYQVKEITKKISFIAGLIENNHHQFYLIIIPKQKAGTTGDLFEWLGEIRYPSTSLIVSYEEISPNLVMGIRLLSNGFASISRLSDVSEQSIHERNIRDCFFRAGIESSIRTLKIEALKRMEFGLDAHVFSDDRAVYGKLLESIKTNDWTLFEKLSRYAIMSLIPMPLSGYGEGDSGRLPDSIGILPDQNGEPENIVLFDAKAIISINKEKFNFKSDDKNKYGDYAQNASILGKNIKFEDIIILFIAPDFSQKNLISFSSGIQDECKKRHISHPVGCVFITFDALCTLFKIASDSLHGAIFKTNDPFGYFQRIIFNPWEMKKEFFNDENVPPEKSALFSYNSIVLDLDIVEKHILNVLKKDEQYKEYFSSYHKIVHKKR